MALLDVFRSDAFSMHNLTASMEKLPYVPSRIGKMNLFTMKPATTRTAYIEEKRGQISVLPTATRGQQGRPTNSENARKVHQFDIPHVPQHDAVMADELEGKRAFGSETQTEVFATIVNDKLSSMKQNHEATWEWHRLGALKGIILDSDGSTEILNLFTFFGITQTEHDFNRYDSGNYDAAAPAQRVRTLASLIKRSIRDALGGTPFTGVTALCGDNYFDYLAEHATVRGAYKNTPAANTVLAESPVTTGPDGDYIDFAGIRWENYRGAVGSLTFVDDNSAVIFPTGAPGIFLEMPAPATYIETVNTRGQRLYVKQKVMDWDQGVELRSESNNLFICTRPACLIASSLVNTAGTGT